MAIAGVTVCLGVVGACGGNDTGGAIDTPESNTTGGSASADGTTTTLDKSPFCVAIRELESLGNAPPTGERTQALVLEQNEQLAGLIEDATNNAPQDAPADVASLLDDYRVVSEAIVAAAGDTEAAMAKLRAEQPELSDRLSQPSAHREAFEFFAELCGTAPPT